MTTEEKLKEKQEFLSKGASPYAETIINRVINNKEPCVLVLPTGAGKSTVIPFAFIQAGYRVMIAEPTVAMCQNIIRSFKVLFPTVRIGRAFAREIDIPKDAKLIVCTNGYLRRRLLNYVRNGVCASVDMTDIIILDEVHFGLLDTHMIVTIWFYCSTKFASTVRMPRLILSSATVKDNILFSRVFSPCVILPPEKFNTSFPIEIKYSSKDFPIDSNDRFVEMGNIIRSIHEMTPIRERILAFIPGNAEQQAVINAMGSLEDYDLVTINSKSVAEDLAPIDRTNDDERRLIILTTPSADAGLTISNLKHVVDSLLIKNNHTQPNGSQSLITEFASKQLFNQRKGRVGRTDTGTYYPMCTQDFFNSGAMPDTYTPELYRLPLYQTIIELISVGIPVEEVFKIYNIPNFSDTIDQMIRWGLIRRSPTSGVLFASSGGNFMSITNIDNPRLAGVLYGWIRLNKSVTEGVVLCQLIANFTSQMLKIPIFEVLPGQNRGTVEKLKVSFIRKNYGRFLGRSDVHTAIRIWNTLQKEGGLSATERWCDINNLQYPPVRTTIKNIQQILHAAFREAQRFAIRESLPLLTEDNKDWLLDEKKVLPTLRCIMQYIYFDEIANRGSSTSSISRYIARDGNMMTPSGGFNQQTADPDSSVTFPSKVIVIGKRTTPYGKLQLTQFLDIDHESEIEDISSEFLRERLGIFKHYTTMAS